MENVLFLKFSQNADLRQLLGDTGDKRLIYNDPDDEYWSIGRDGQGRNCLGILLERVRDRLRRS
jgi:N-glycosidase YbiA